jgi:hypothetical protein
MPYLHARALGCVRLESSGGMSWNGSAPGIHSRVWFVKRKGTERFLRRNILPRCGMRPFHRFGGMCAFPPANRSVSREKRINLLPALIPSRAPQPHGDRQRRPVKSSDGGHEFDGLAASKRAVAGRQASGSGRRPD